MLLISHPTGNRNVRALVEGALEAGRLDSFATSLGFAGQPRWSGLLPESMRSELRRRCYDVPTAKLVSWPERELCRLLAMRAGLTRMVRHESGWASVDAVYRDLDARVAARLPRWQRNRALTVAYAYEDGALATFGAARRLGIMAVYDLPIAYGQTTRRLLDEEAQRLPQWEPTLVSTQDSAAKLERKVAELEAADLVVCPSHFVLDSIPEQMRDSRRCIVAEFGSPPVSEGERRPPAGRRIRFLFAGSLGQRKGLADVFEAFRLLKRSDIELVVMGSLLMPLEFYRRHGGDFTYEATRPHAEVLRLMDGCDVLLLPSIVEGRALVQQEAMSRGLPIIVTRNAGGEDLVEEGRTGFLVPIRSPEALAAKINWIADRRETLPEMSFQARIMSARFTWTGYAQRILAAIFDTRQCGAQ